MHSADTQHKIGHHVEMENLLSKLDIGSIVSEPSNWLHSHLGLEISCQCLTHHHMLEQIGASDTRDITTIGRI